MCFLKFFIFSNGDINYFFENLCLTWVCVCVCDIRVEINFVDFSEFCGLMTFVWNNEEMD